MNLFIFDLDGVILSTSKNHYEAWKKMAESIGIEIDKSFNETLKGIPREASLDKILAHGNKVVDEENKRRLLELKNNIYKKSIADLTPSDMYDGAIEFLDLLKKKNKKIALASASKNAPFILKQLQIESYFDYIVNPARLTNHKPHPQIFLKAAHALDESPTECIGIEDAQAGIEAINSAGMFSIGIGDPDILSSADLVYPSIRYMNYNKIHAFYNKTMH